MKEQPKNLKRILCKSKEHVLEELNKFINKKCEKGGKHDFYKVELVCGCSKCNSTFTIDKKIMEEVDIDKILCGSINKSFTQRDICHSLGHTIVRKPHKLAHVDAKILYCEDCKIELGTITETKSGRVSSGKKTK